MGRASDEYQSAQVYMPDYFKGDPIPGDALSNPDVRVYINDFG